MNDEIILREYQPVILSIGLSQNDVSELDAKVFRNLWKLSIGALYKNMQSMD